MKTILLDTGPLGLLAHTGSQATVLRCRQWADDLAAAGHRLLVPEIADYELRRELVRLGWTGHIAALDGLAVRFGYLAITTPAMRLAADLWATARRQGCPTAGPNDIDGDVILAAQAQELHDPSVVVATGNPTHLSRYVAAEQWELITP
jgi:hypothetical protein